jgi:hypothetical protein
MSQLSHANGTDAGSERGGSTILGCKVAYVLCPPLMCPSEPGSSGRFPPLDMGVYDRLLLRQRTWCGTHTGSGACRSVATRLSAVQPSCLASVRTELDSSEAVIGVGGRSGQLRPYARPVARRLPLAIMGARARVRRQSMAACSGHSAPCGVARNCLTTVLPITLFSACRRIERARARRLPYALERHAVAPAGSATPPFAR